MYYKERKKKRIIIITVVIIGIFSIMISLLFLNKERNLSKIECIIKDGFLFVEGIARKPVNFISKTIEENKDKKDLYNKYKELEKKVDEYENVQIINKELKTEIDNLKKILELNNVLSDRVATNALVIKHDLGYWYDTLTIDKGLNDEIEVGSAVVVNEGLIGRVINVSNSNSVVRLLTSENNNKISVKIESEGNYLYGLLTGYDSDKNIYKVEGISQIDKIDIGSLVTTTGLVDSFPSGIVIGKVNDVKNDNYDLSQIVEVNPSVDLNNVSIVTILKRGNYDDNN